MILSTNFFYIWFLFQLDSAYRLRSTAQSWLSLTTLTIVVASLRDSVLRGPVRIFICFLTIFSFLTLLSLIYLGFWPARTKMKNESNNHASAQPKFWKTKFAFLMVDTVVSTNFVVVFHLLEWFLFYFSGIGTCVFAPLIEWLLNEYGWHGTLIILSAVLLNQVSSFRSGKSTRT